MPNGILRKNGKAIGGSEGGREQAQILHTQQQGDAALGQSCPQIGQDRKALTLGDRKDLQADRKGGKPGQYEDGA